MDNKAIAGLLYETADLLEIDGQDSFRIRSYRNAAEAIEALPQQIADLMDEPKKILAIQGIGKGMLANLQMLFKEGRIEAHAELLKKYRPSMLELLKIQGLGPKTISLIWSAYQVCDLEGVEKLAREGKIRELPRMGEKHEAKLLKAIEDYRRIAGRFPARYRRSAGGEADRASAVDSIMRRHRQNNPRRIVAPRPRDRRRSRHSGHGAGLH
jgi:DNA polymerase (family 10)